MPIYCDDCDKRASFGYEGDKKPTKCVTHKLSNMINIVNKKCDFLKL